MPHRNLKGVLLFLSGLFLFSSVDTTAKYLTAFYSVQFLVWARFAVHLAIMLVAVAPGMGRELVVTRRPGLMIFRALLLVASSLFIQMAFRSLPLAETTAVFFVAPVIVALLAGPLLGEKVALKTWLATLAGFCGVLLIARPGGALLGIGLVYTLAAALCYSLYQILTRKLADTEPTMRQLFYTALIGTLAMSLIVPPYWIGEWPPLGHCLLVASLGLYGGVGHFLIIGAYRTAPASTLAPMMYIQLIWATLLGWAVFGQLPDSASTTGMAIIGVAGMTLALRRPRRGVTEIQRSEGPAIRVER
jgi:drug/metabolite transporter (DMT)-like permease